MSETLRIGGTPVALETDPRAPTAGGWGLRGTTCDEPLAPGRLASGILRLSNLASTGLGIASRETTLRTDAQAPVRPWYLSGRASIIPRPRLTVHYAAATSGPGGRPLASRGRTFGRRKSSRPGRRGVGGLALTGRMPFGPALFLQAPGIRAGDCCPQAS